MTFKELNQEIGHIDLDLFDQVLKGRIMPSMKILDAGCGEGRNLHYFIKNYYEVYGIDENPAAIKMLQMIARGLNAEVNTDRFKLGDVSHLPYKDRSLDVVISNDVLHFAKNELQFWQMFNEMIRVLKPGGLGYLKMKTTIPGTSNISGHKDYFLLTEHLIQQIKEKERINLIEPEKKSIISGLDCYCVMVFNVDG